MTQKGRCLCGGVSYEIRGPLTGLLNCHCSDCRKAHGAAFRTRASVQTKDFVWICGQNLLTRYESKPGEFRTFCRVCGSPLLTEFTDHPEEYGFALGTLDTDPGIEPECHVWVSEGAAWHKLTDALPRLEAGRTQAGGASGSSAAVHTCDSPQRSAKNEKLISDPNIRPATGSDASTIFALVNQLHESIAIEEARFSEAFPSVLRNPNHCCLVFEADSGVVGYASGYKHITLAAGQHTAFLDEIVVKPEWRGDGFGSRLMAAFEEWAGNHHCNLVALASGGAREFYERLGYRSRAGYYKKSLKSEP